MLRNMLGHHGFWGLQGASQLGMFRDGPLLINAQASTNPGATAPTEGACTADGQLIWHSGAWHRLSVGEVCQAITDITTHPHEDTGGGVDVHDLVCLQPADTTVVQDGIILAPTPGTPITYQWVCTDPTKIGFTRAQRDTMLTWFFWGASQLISPCGTVRFSDYLPINISTGTFHDQFFPACVLTGQRMIKKFKGADGDDKIVVATVSGPNKDWSKPVTVTLTWNHDDSLFETVDKFITSISPWDPSSTLCSLLPVATKVPNPYVAAGSIVLQLSGKCNDTCPTGMLFDSVAKTCSCPVGFVYDQVAKKCVILPPLPPATEPAIPTWMIVLGVVAGLGLMAAIFGKKQTAPA